MKKLLVVASVVTGAVYPAAACDWSREASAQAPVVAATTTTTQRTSEATPTAQPITSVAVDERARQPISEPVPVVLVTDRR